MHVFLPHTSRQDRGRSVSPTTTTTPLAVTLTGVTISWSLSTDKRQRLVAFITGRIIDLQAPARSEAAREWLKALEAELGEAVYSGQHSKVVRVLPKLFEFVFSRIEEIRRDVANAHIRLVAPYLARHGTEYERSKFDARLAAGAVSVEKTKAWVDEAVATYLEEAKGLANEEGSRSVESCLAALREGHEDAHREVIQRAFVGLLHRPMRLDSAQSLSSSLPETLAMDASRLAAIRDDADRVTLVATLCVLTRQVLARLRLGCPPKAMSALQSKLSALLRQTGVALPQIVDECVAAAKRVAAAQGGALPPAEAEGLASLLRSSADTSNEVFRVFFGRVGLVLKGLAGGGDAGDLCGRNGLSDFEKELAPAGQGLRRAFTHNLAVFGPRYAALVKAAAEGHAAA